MPCGGIYPIDAKHPFAAPGVYDCSWCNKDIELKNLMFCDEWDCYLHRDCVTDFLKGEEGQVVIEHGHQVVLYFENTEPVQLSFDFEREGQ